VPSNLNHWQPLKHGNTATVVQTCWRGTAVVVKRYNNKSSWHRLRRLLGRDRGLNSWIYGHTLRFVGVATPRPLVLLRTRLAGPTYLISAAVAGAELSAKELDGSERLCLAAVALLDALAAEDLVHGDTKLTNMLRTKPVQPDAAELLMIDLDAMQMPRSRAAAVGAQRDRRRFLRNFADAPELQRRFRFHLGL